MCRSREAGRRRPSRGRRGAHGGAQKRAKKHYQEQALRYAKVLSNEAEAPVEAWFGDVLADDADQQIPRVRKEQVQRDSFLWTFLGSQ